MCENELSGIEILQKIIDEHNQLKFELRMMTDLHNDYTSCKYNETWLKEEIKNLKEENKKLKYDLLRAEERIRYLTDSLANLNKDDNLL